MDEKPGKATVLLEHLEHASVRCIALAFPYDTVLITAAKKVGARWSSTHKRWYTPNTPQHLRTIFQAFKGLAWVDTTALFNKPTPASTATEKAPAQQTRPAQAAPNAEQQEALAAMQRKLEIARYSPRTIDAYLNATKHLFLHFPAKHPGDIRTEDIEAYQHHLATVRKVSNSHLNQVVNAVRYYYMNVVGDAKRVTFIERPRKETKLPLVLSKSEVAAV